MADRVIDRAFVEVLPKLDRFARETQTGVKKALEGSGRDIDQSSARTSARVSKRFGGMTASVGKSFKGLGGIVTAAFAGVGAIGFLNSAVGAASDLNETVSKSKAVFGPAQAIIDRFATNSATKLGQTKEQAIGAAAQFGNMFNQLGIGSKPAATMSTQMVQLATDFASFHNADITDVLEAQQAAFRGEFDSVQRFVPTINATAVEQEGLRLHLAKSTKELTAQDKAVATQSLLMKGAGKAVGDFARTSGGLANQQRILSANVQELKVGIGQALLPVLTKLVTWINKSALPAFMRFGGWLKENRFLFAQIFLGIAEAVVKMVKLSLPAAKVMTSAFLGMIGTLLEGAAKVDDAFGGKLGLRKKADDFKAFAEGVAEGFDTAIAKTGEWDTAIDKAQKQIEIKANIEDLETKLADAKGQLKHWLPKAKEAEVKATIKDLQTKLAAAHTELDAKWITKARIAKLQANKLDLDGKIKAAKTALADPHLTATKKAKLTADIKELQARRAAAQKEINSLHGKSVTIELKFTSAGVSLTAPGGPRVGATGGKVTGPGGPTDDKAGLWALSSREWIIRAKASQKYGDKAMASINAGTAAVFPMAGGGPAWPAFDRRYNSAVNRGATRFGGTFGPYGRALSWARAQDPRQYQWGGTGNPGWDCSGFMSGIANVIRGHAPGHRLFATGSFPTAGFSPGMGLFSIGSRRGNPGHMAGTLLGTNVESRGGDGVVIGSGARGARNGLFGGNIWHMAGGGRAGDAPFDFLDPRGRNFVPGLRKVLAFDNGGFLPPGLSMAYNGTGRPEPVGGLTVIINAPHYVGDKNDLVKAIDDLKRRGRLP